MEQVQALSAVAETLTLRLLDLEERILVQEQALGEAQARDLGVLAERRLADTEERLRGLEQMLASSPARSADPGSDRPDAVAAVEAPGLVRQGGLSLAADLAAADEALESGVLAERQPDSDDGWETEDDWDELERLTA